MTTLNTLLETYNTQSKAELNHYFANKVPSKSLKPLGKKMMGKFTNRVPRGKAYTKIVMIEREKENKNIF